MNPAGILSHRLWRNACLLGTKGQLQAVAWTKNKSVCTVRRFWDGADDEVGHLIHRRDGNGSAKVQKAGAAR